MTVITEETRIPRQATPDAPAREHAVVEKEAAPREHAPQASTVHGIADIDDGRGFLRSSAGVRSPGDVPLTSAQIKHYGLRKGDLIEATLASRDGSAKRGGKAIDSVETVNGMPAGTARKRRRFEELTPVYPNERLRLEDGDPSPLARIIDLVSPIGKGQRGLIVAPPKAGKTMVLKTIAGAIANAYPDIHLMMVLVGERP